MGFSPVRPAGASAQRPASPPAQSSGKRTSQIGVTLLVAELPLRVVRRAAAAGTGSSSRARRTGADGSELSLPAPPRAGAAGDSVVVGARSQLGQIKNKAGRRRSGRPLKPTNARRAPHAG